MTTYTAFRGPRYCHTAVKPAPLGCAWLPIMGAIVNMPPEVRAARFSRELDRFVIEALRAVKRQGGERAFHHTARDLVISVCAILAYERGTDAVVDLFDLIERVLSDTVD